ncbi:MAG: tRNA glutamyl-Q(34) synthetase GluQRS [Pseudomonadota bacterium]
MGSLVAALASFLDVRKRGGEWLLRIEDVDTVRSRPEFESALLRELVRHGLHWDGQVVRQSQRSEHYLNALQQLEILNRSYPCTCSRQFLKRRGCLSNAQGELVYPGFCRPARAQTEMHSLSHRAAAWRFLIVDDAYDFEDLLAGRQSGRVLFDVGDFVLRRADGCFAYHLAVVVDDFLQGVTRVIRGADILPLTGRHILLQRALGYGSPVYGHIPLVLDGSGEKLSKSASARALAESPATDNLVQALAFLGVQIESRDFSSPEEILDHALRHYTLT